MVEDIAYVVYTMNDTMDYAASLMESNPKAKKTAQKLHDALTALMKDMVVTTGDNYVASAEPELREKMTELYSNVATNFDGVSASDLASFELINTEYQEALGRLTAIMDKEGKKFNSFLAKNDLPEVTLKSKEEFLGN